MITKVLGIKPESDNVFPLTNLICYKLFGTDPYERIAGTTSMPDLESATNFGSSRSSLLEETVIHQSEFNNEDKVRSREYCDDAQAIRDHEFRMLQLKLQMQMQMQQQEREMQQQERDAQKEVEKEKIKLEQMQQQEREEKIKLEQMQQQEREEKIKLE